MRARQRAEAAVLAVRGRARRERASGADRPVSREAIEDVETEVDRRVTAAEATDEREVTATLGRRDRRVRQGDDAALELDERVGPIDDAIEAGLRPRDDGLVLAIVAELRSRPGPTRVVEGRGATRRGRRLVRADVRGRRLGTRRRRRGGVLGLRARREEQARKEASRELLHIHLTLAVGAAEGGAEGAGGTSDDATTVRFAVTTLFPSACVRNWTSNFPGSRNA